MGHAHNVYDADPHFVINADTRVITDESETGTSLMQYDHNSERITFEMPRYIDEHDMSICDRVEVHYINIGTDGKRTNGVYEVDDMTVDPEDNELVLFTWLVSQNATSYAGSLSFVVRFICTSDGTFEYVWNTAIYKDIAVGNGMDNSGAITTEYADILGQWYDEIETKIATAKEDIVAKIDFDELADKVLDSADVYSKEEIDIMFAAYITDVDDLIGDCITFTIDGTTYHAEEGMTWADWVDSAYNTGGFYLLTLPTSTYSYVLCKMSDGRTGTISLDGTSGLSADNLIVEQAYVLQVSSS